MTDPVVIPEDGIQLLRTYLLHCRYVQAGMRRIVQALETRLELHDTSKLRDDEFAGFSRINKAAREHPYGSPEYRAGLKQEKSTVERHYLRNSHHPEWISEKERWREIADATGYEVSDFGRVRSVDRVVSREGPKGDLSRKGAILASHRTPKGYRRVQLSVDGKPLNRLVHVLVARAFVGGSEREGVEVNHYDGNKENNIFLNLEWVTRNEQLQHAYDTGLRPRLVFVCEELDLEAVGATAMVALLRERGYGASESGLYNAANGEVDTHCGLHFRADRIEEPAHVAVAGSMTWLDIVEMVCDWRGAYLAYGSQGTWADNLQRQRERYAVGKWFTEGQWWLIDQVAASLDKDSLAPP